MWPAPTTRMRSGRRRRAADRTTQRVTSERPNASGSHTASAAASGRPKLPGRMSIPAIIHSNERLTRAPIRARASSKGDTVRLFEL